MSDGTVEGLYGDFGLSRPTVPVSTREGEPVPHVRKGDAVVPAATSHDELLGYLTELTAVLTEIERLKRIARTPYDWQVIMMYIAAQKPRVSEMTSKAKRLYAQEFGQAYDRIYQPPGQGAPRGSGVSSKTAEIRAKAEAGLAYEVAERMERTWKDLQDLMWACKNVADAQLMEKNDPIFDAHPEHMFSSS